MDVRENILFAIVSAILATLLGYILAGINLSEWQPRLVVLLLLVGLALAISLLGPLHLVLSSAKGLDLKGSWVSEWSYTKGGQVVTVNETIRVRQLGRYVLVDGQSRQIQGPHPSTQLRYKMRAELSTDGVIDGRWWNCEPGKRYSGVFQGTLVPAGDSVQILWIGTERGGLRSGEGHWHRI